MKRVPLPKCLKKFFGACDQIEISKEVQHQSSTPPTKKNHFIEPMLLFSWISATLKEVIAANVVELHYCVSEHEIATEESCFNSSAPHYDDMQKFASTFNSAKAFIEIFIPCLLLCFFGPWSDTFGRKTLLVSSLTGQSICHVMLALMGGIWTLHPSYLLLCSVPIALFVGPAFGPATSSYVTDVTTKENRTHRMSIIQCLSYAGILLGTLCAPFIVQILGLYVAVYVCSTFFVGLALLYAIFYLDESIPTDPDEPKKTFESPLQWKYPANLFRSLNTKDYQIYLLILIRGLFILSNNGENSVFYLFVQKKFSWNIRDYAILMTFAYIINIFWGFAFIRIFSTWLKFPELCLTSVYAISRVFSSIVLFYAVEDWHIYVAKAIQGLMTIVGPLVNSYFTKLLEPEHIGKFFTLMAIWESLMPIVGTFLYSTTYNAYLSVLSSAIFLLSSAICGCMFLLLLFVIFYYKRVV